jgi:hypothetical protein
VTLVSWGISRRDLWSGRGEDGHSESGRQGRVELKAGRLAAA